MDEASNDLFELLLPMRISIVLRLWRGILFMQDAVRLATAYAECSILRLLLKPLLLPLKLFMTWKGLLLWKGMER